MSKKKLVAAIIAAIVLLVLGGYASANATADGPEFGDDKCYDTVIDKEAYTETVVVTPEIPGTPEVEEVIETIEHPAITKTIGHDAVMEEVHHPAVYETIEHPEITETIEHPAEYKDVHHEAKTHKEYFFAKFVRTRYKKNGQWGEYSVWTKYSPEQHTSWERSTDPVGSPALHGQGNDWQRQWQARWTGIEKVVVDEPARTERVKVKDAWTETVVIQEAHSEIKLVSEAWIEAILVKEAWTEEVVVKEAWTEEVVTTEYQPAVPAVPAVTEEVHHEATYKDVEVPCPPVETPTTDTPEEPKKEEPLTKKVNKDVLPQTGSGMTIALAAAGAFALTTGATFMLLGRRRNM